MKKPNVDFILSHTASGIGATRGSKMQIEKHAKINSLTCKLNRPIETPLNRVVLSEARGMGFAKPI